MWRLCSLVVLAGAVACGPAGCKSTPNPYETPPPTRSLLEVRHHVGGTHYRTIVHGGTWYQTFSNQLLVLDDRTVVQPAGSNVIDTIELADIGTSGPATDMLLHDGRLYVLLKRDQVIEFSLNDPWSPKEERRFSAQQLGVRPTRLSVVDDQLYISGHGGIVRLASFAEPPSRLRRGERQLGPGVVTVVTSDDEFGPVTKSSQGLVATIGRRIVSVPDLKYLGSANELIALPGELGGPELRAFVWKGSESTVVGLMGSDFREHSRKTFLSDVHSVKPMAGQLWVVSDDAIVAFDVRDGELVEAQRIAVYGARDVAQLSENHLAVAGSFGRSIYRIEQDRFGRGDTFLAAHREPSKLVDSMYDGRFVLAGSREGYWLYEIERRVTLAERTAMQPSEPARSAATLRGSANLDEAGETLTVTAAGESYTYSAPHGSRMRCAVAVDGDIWIGHEHGIIVLSGEATSPIVKAELTIPGPVTALYPLRVGGGATYVSILGGFGVARWFAEVIPFEK